MNIFDHPVVRALPDQHIKFTVDYPSDLSTVVQVEGFSKSGTVMLYMEGNALKCLARYNEVNHIEDFDDLVAVAYDWWYRYRDRSPFEAPHIMWLPHFIKRGWVEECHTVTYKASK